MQQCRVSFGANSLPFDFDSGDTAREAFEEFRGPFQMNAGTDYGVIVNGRESDLGHVLKNGDHVQFTQPTGEKA